MLIKVNVMKYKCENLDSVDLCSDYYPNKETLKSIENVEAGNNITEYASFQDMIKKVLGKVDLNK